jgi:soluble lytic murein transglycosylase-like protein
MTRMARLLAILALIGALTAPAPGGADQLYSYKDAGGVWHFTNVPQDGRYRRVPQPGIRAGADGVYRIALSGRKQGRAPPLLRRTSNYDEHIRAAAGKYGLAPQLLRAVMAAESNFDPAAVSLKGATGLMQLMPATARDMYVDDIFDPAQNIEGGARYLRLLLDRFDGHLEQVLAAYNAGPSRVLRHGGAIPPIPETQAYVGKVLALYESYMGTP